jgi:hypothetical protein
MPTESQLQDAALRAEHAWPANDRPRESRDANMRNDRNPSESRVGVQRAVLALRAIRQRYESGRNAHPDVRGYSVHVVVDCGDMVWITAAIDALEKTVVAGATETATPAQALGAAE